MLFQLATLWVFVPACSPWMTYLCAPIPERFDSILLGFITVSVFGFSVTQDRVYSIGSVTQRQEFSPPVHRPSRHLTSRRIAQPGTPLTAPFSVIANLTPPTPIFDTPHLPILSTARQHDTRPEARRSSQYRLNLDKVERGR